MGAKVHLQEVVTGFGRGSVGDSRATLLIVESGVIVRLNLYKILITIYRVVKVAEGGAGIRKAKEIVPDLIVSDVNMPGVDGYKLCLRLKQDTDTNHIPIILLSGAAREDDILLGLETGADEYITQPFSTRVLLARIKNLIDLRRQLQRKIRDEMVPRPREISVSSLDREFINDVQVVIEENLSDPGFNVEQMTKKLYMSQSSLYRKVEALTGLSPRLFIRSYRLKRAAQLLKAGFGNVTEVAFAVGFSSTPYFTRCFKQEFQCLPSGY